MEYLEICRECNPEERALVDRYSRRGCKIFNIIKVRELISLFNNVAEVKEQPVYLKECPSFFKKISYSGI